MYQFAHSTSASPSLEPVVLEGNLVRLEPLTLGHVDRLSAVGLDDRLWGFMLMRLQTREDMTQFVEGVLARLSGDAMPFVTIEKSSGTIVGKTRFMNYDRANSRVEVGGTWIGKPWQRTAINTEAKYIMLTHAFKKLHCARVELRTDVLNTPSRTAIERLGAIEEGIFRKHALTWTGRRRDTVCYSILDDEWPAVRTRLEGFLKRSNGHAH